MLLAWALGALLLTGVTGPEATLPNGRRITPVGSWTQTAPYPFALAIRPDGGQVVVPCVGFPFALTIVDAPRTAGERVRQLPLPGQKPEDVEVHTGVAYGPDGQRAYVATGDSGAVQEYETANWTKTRRFELGRDSYTGALAVDKPGRRLYVLDEGAWRVVILDLTTGQVLRRLETGVNPIALALSPDRRRLYVVNSGLFEYQLLPGVDRDRVLETGLRFAPFGYPSRRAVKSLGDPNSERGSSLWTYQLDVQPVRVTKLRLGAKIAGRVVGGGAPSAVAADREEVFVALAHEDCVAVISADGSRVERSIPLSPFGNALRGVMPSGLALSADRLYVSEAGINAVATVDRKTAQVLGHEPVGWNPSAVALMPGGNRLLVVNTKGRGTGPNGGAGFGAEGKYIGELAFGSVSSLPVDAASEASTAQVLANNRAALANGSAVPRLRHVFLIIRENRTFDEVFGDLPNAEGDRALARFGMNGWTEEAPKQEGVRVTPNAHALAGQFATSDQFFVDSDVSADGHRWLLGIAPTPWFNRAWTANYGGRRHEDAWSTAPGRRAMFGGSDAPMPEDEPQFGSLWEHVARGKLPIRNYGESLEIEGSDERDGAEPEGQRNLLNAPLLRPVYESSDRHYPTFNLGIPDVLRVKEFRHDFSKLVAGGRVPALTVVRLPNDHMAVPRPADGYPYRASFVADNDLALGQIVEYLSGLPIWRDSAVFVLEDDAQGGRDHVDAHRSVLLVASPWVKPGVVGHRHVNMGSVEKTIYEALGLGPLNLEDALARDLGELFDTAPHLERFVAQAANPRIFDAGKARVAQPKSKAEREALLRCDDVRDLRIRQ